MKQATSTHDPKPAGPAPEPRWRRRKDARPAEILDAALAQFVEHGYRATRLEDVAARAGVSKGTMYLYFDSKETLFKEMVRQAVLPSIEAAEERVRTHAGTAASLVEEILRVRWHALFVSRTSGIPKLLMSEAVHFPDLARWYHQEIIARANALLARAIEFGIERAEFRRVDPRQTAYLAVAPLLLASMWKHSFMRCTTLDFQPDQFLAGHVEQFLRGLAPDPAPEAPHD